MKFIKRELACPFCTASLWWIPIMTYFIMKMNNILSPRKEWIWWVVIPTMFLIWVLLNWKIINKNDKKPSTF
jgi:hypothetical protein